MNDREKYASLLHCAGRLALVTAAAGCVIDTLKDTSSELITCQGRGCN